MKIFTGKTAIVTGGGRDIGKAISLKLARNGANTVINYCNDETAASQTVSEINDGGGKAVLYHGDMTKQNDVVELVKATQAAYGHHFDILVNVAGGVVDLKPLDEMDEFFFNQVIQLNLNTVFLTIKHLSPYMSAGGSIINIASQAGRDCGPPGASAYAAGKAALMTFSQCMAKELGPRGIRVNAVCPGMIATSFHDRFSPPEVRASVASSTPLKREGHTSEVADLVSYLASDEASFITGANIDVNGGLLVS